MLPVRKPFCLLWQVGSATIHQHDAGQAVLLGDLECAKVFLDTHREIGAALYRCIITDDHAFDAFNTSDPGNHARARTVVAIHVV